MFEVINAGTEPLRVRASLWECFKAGVAFTSGALLVSFTAAVFWFAVMIRVLPRLMLQSLQ